MISDTLSNKALKTIELSLLKEGLIKVYNKDKINLPLKEGILHLIDRQFALGTINADDGKPQCLARKRRSSGDMFRLIKFYYPEVTFKQVRKLLYGLVISCDISMSFCKDIQKRVFYDATKIRIYLLNGGHYNDEYSDEYGAQLIISRRCGIR